MQVSLLLYFTSPLYHRYSDVHLWCSQEQQKASSTKSKGQFENGADFIELVEESSESEDEKSDEEEVLEDYLYKK